MWEKPFRKLPSRQCVLSLPARLPPKASVARPALLALKVVLAKRVEAHDLGIMGPAGPSRSPSGRRSPRVVRRAPRVSKRQPETLPTGPRRCDRVEGMLSARIVRRSSHDENLSSSTRQPVVPVLDHVWSISSVNGRVSHRPARPLGPSCRRLIEEIWSPEGGVGAGRATSSTPAGSGHAWHDALGRHSDGGGSVRHAGGRGIP